MATTLATVVGDVGNILGGAPGLSLTGRANCRVRLRANMPIVVDRDNAELRILDDADWVDVGADGTFTLDNVLAGTDTVAAGTLQYYLDVEYIVDRKWRIHTLPESGSGFAYVIVEGTQDITELDPVPEVDPSSVVPIDLTTLVDAEAYTDTQIDAHEAASNPHPQYARMVDGNLAAILSGRIIQVGAGGEFPPVIQGAILVYGGL